jgi:hypothetical protein
MLTRIRLKLLVGKSTGDIMPAWPVKGSMKPEMEAQKIIKYNTPDAHRRSLSKSSRAVTAERESPAMVVTANEKKKNHLMLKLMSISDKYIEYNGAHKNKIEAAENGRAKRFIIVGMQFS